MPTEEMLNSYGAEQLLKDFHDNMIRAQNLSQQELFIHDYLPIFQLSRTGGGSYSVEDSDILKSREDLYFNILSYEAVSVVDSTVKVYESVEEEEPIVDSYEFLDLSFGDGSTMSIQLSQDEKEIISYRKPVMFQLSFDEQVEMAQRNYVNSIQAREMDFDIVSSLGSITTEDVTIESTTVGETTSLTSTTETIIDVGGITTGGY